MEPIIRGLIQICNNTSYINKMNKSLQITFCKYFSVMKFQKIQMKRLYYTQVKLRSSATFEVKEYIGHNLKELPSTKATLTREDALKFYSQMRYIREMERVCGTLYLAKLIKGFLHLYSGQEACAIGMKAAMRENDDICGAYRIHGIAYVMGSSLKEVVGELCAKQVGTSKGKGGSPHMYGPHFYGGHAIVGAQIPVGTGIAFASKYRKNGAVCLTMLGDGAINQGQLYESFNMAALWKLPCIYVVENNHYAMGTSIERHSAMTELFRRGHYVPGIWVDGMDVLAVREATEFCIEYVLKNGPILMELATYRYFGHSVSDPDTTYRSRAEITKVRQQEDCIKVFEDKVLESELLTSKELKKITKEAHRKVAQAVAEVKQEKELDISKIASDVMVNQIGPVRNNLPWNPLKHHILGKPINLN